MTSIGRAGIMASTHENLQEHARVKSASDRAFGLTVGGILGLLGLYRLLLRPEGPDWVALAVLASASVLLILGAVAPLLLAPLNRAWTKLGLLLGKIVTPVVLLLIYGLTIVPLGLVRRALGHDPLQLRRDPEATTYWIERSPPGPAPPTMTNQF
jgi:hypothetical protein